MKLLKFEEFLKLPAGVIFVSGREWVFDGVFKMKGESILNCFGGFTEFFFSIDLCTIDSNEPGEWINRLFEMRDDGASYDINKCDGKDCGRNEDIFLIYEKKDLCFLKNIIEEQINRCS